MLFRIYINLRFWLRPVCAKRGHNWSWSGLYCESCGLGKRDFLL